VARVTEKELLDAAALANRHGLAICPNSAVALAGAAKLRAEGVIKNDDLVVVVATAHALKFAATAAAYHRGEGRFANPPRRLPATLDAVLEALGG
jgi:threonine synthase